MANRTTLTRIEIIIFILILFTIFGGMFLCSKSMNKDIKDISKEINNSYQCINGYLWVSLNDRIIYQKTEDGQPIRCVENIKK